MRCPYLDKQELCSIYSTRPGCCRSFPNGTPGMFCESSASACVYDAIGNLDCFSCKDKCCNHLAIPKTTPVEKVINLLDISCARCKEIYVDKEESITLSIMYSTSKSDNSG